MRNTLEAVARRGYADNLHRWQPVHAERILADMQKDVFPHIGQIPLAEVSVSDVKNVIAAIVARGANVTVEKVRQWIGAVYTYAAMLEKRNSRQHCLHIMQTSIPHSRACY